MALELQNHSEGRAVYKSCQNALSQRSVGTPKPWKQLDQGLWWALHEPPLSKACCSRVAERKPLLPEAWMTEVRWREEILSNIEASFIVSSLA